MGKGRAIEPETKQYKQSSHFSRPWGGIAFSPLHPEGEKVYPVECVAYSSGAKERIQIILSILSKKTTPIPRITSLSPTMRGMVTLFKNPCEIRVEGLVLRSAKSP